MEIVDDNKMGIASEKHKQKEQFNDGGNSDHLCFARQMHQCSHMDSIPLIHSTDSKSMNGSEYSEMYETKNVVARTKPFYPDENNLKPEFVYPTTISTHAGDFSFRKIFATFFPIL
uniref:Ovule protein n=1 Tax=Ascaris lumbricoides TaxID=6252 RepID=A0A0M3ILZ1_ASCLU